MTSSQGIRRYISVLAAFKFIFLIVRLRNNVLLKQWRNIFNWRCVWSLKHLIKKLLYKRSERQSVQFKSNHAMTPVDAQSKAWMCDHSLAGDAGSNPTGGKNVSCERCVLSGRGLCIGLITCPEESYWVWCVCECVCEWRLDIQEARVH
jgi:hypothetical protein